MSLSDSDVARITALDPLRIGMSVAERFMKIDPPPNTYMYHLGMSGLLDLYEITREERLINFVEDSLEKLTGKRTRFDWRLYQITTDPRFLDGMKEAGEAWLANPRRDREGALLDPRGRYTVDIVSGLCTVPVIFGHHLQDARYFDEAYLQLDIARSYLEDPVTGLWFSRWGHGLHPHRPNPGLWGRGNGWLVNAWGRVMHLWDPDHARYAEVLALWQQYCRSVAAFQTPSGLMRQLMNRPGSFEEATGSGLIGSGIGYGVLHGTLPNEMGAVAYRLVAGLSNLVDAEGNLYNVSTTAGGYNFEQQYESCATFNDAHGDGSVMGACAALHQLLRKGVAFDRTLPEEKPVIVTEKIPGCLSFWTHDLEDMVDIAIPVTQRLLSLDELPALDTQGCTMLGLLHRYDNHGDQELLAKVRQLLDTAKDRLDTVTRLRVTGELTRRAADPRMDAALVKDVDAYLGTISRDREGLILDEAGGYSIGRLYNFLPLLGRAGAVTGDIRYFDEACAQLLGYQQWLEEPVTGMWFSAYGHGAHPRRVTPGFWGLGNAYAIAGVVDLLDDLPRDHTGFVDVVCLLRDLVKPMHAWLPVWGGWRQILDDLRSCNCVATNGLLTYGTAKAVWRGWVKSAYYAAPLGGVYFLGKLVRPDASYDLASLPTGGLDTIEAYAGHVVENDPYALGFVLSGCMMAESCRMTGINYGAEDTRLGAR